jgi:tetratricopeptide (TPR) repeat protein
MAAERNHWLWFSDTQWVENPLSEEDYDPQAEKRAAAHPALVRAMELHQEGRHDEALIQLGAAEEATDSRADALGLAGQILFEQKCFEEAAESYRKLTECSPDHPTAHFNRGVSLARLERWHEAVECFQRAAVAAPQRTEVWFGLGVSLLHERRGAEARAAFQQSLKLRPEHVPSLAGEAVALQMDKKPLPALAIYRRLLNEHAPPPELLANALAAAVELRERALVREWAAKLLRADPGSRAAWLALATVAIEAGDFQAGSECCAKLTENAPDCFEDWYNLGVCYQRLEQSEEAFNAFEHAAGIRPDHAGTLKALAMLAIERGDVEAGARYHKALGGVSWEIAFQLGLLYQDQGKLEEAAAQYREAIERKADCVEALINLGHVMQRLGHPTEAREYWQKAVQMRPEVAAQYFGKA